MSVERWSRTCDAAGEALLWAHLESVAKRNKEAAKAAAAAAMASQGVERVAGILFGEKVGILYVSDPKPSARVVDDGGFMGWVKQRWPDEIVESVRPAFTKHLLDSATAADGVYLMGEHCPHVVMDQPAPKYTAKPDHETANTVLKAQLALGRVTLEGVQSVSAPVELGALDA